MRLSWGSRKEVLSVHTPLFIREEIELKLPRGGTLPLILMSRVTKVPNFYHGGVGTEGPIILLA